MAFEISLHRVHDTVKIKEGTESILLHVDGDPMRMVAGLTQAQKALQAITQDSTEDEVQNAARYFCTVIFGKEQTEKLEEFYHHDAGCIINLCGQYFEKRLSRLILKAQKK